MHIPFIVSLVAIARCTNKSHWFRLFALKRRRCRYKCPNWITVKLNRLLFFFSNSNLILFKKKNLPFFCCRSIYRCVYKWYFTSIFLFASLKNKHLNGRKTWLDVKCGILWKQMAAVFIGWHILLVHKLFPSHWPFSLNTHLREKSFHWIFYIYSERIEQSYICASIKMKFQLNFAAIWIKKECKKCLKFIRLPLQAKCNHWWRQMVKRSKKMKINRFWPRHKECGTFVCVYSLQKKVSAQF